MGHDGAEHTSFTERNREKGTINTVADNKFKQQGSRLQFFNHRLGIVRKYNLNRPKKNFVPILNFSSDMYTAIKHNTQRMRIN